MLSCCRALPFGIWNFPIWNFHPHRFDQHRGSGGAVVIYKYFTPLGCFSASSPRSLRLKSFGLRVVVLSCCRALPFGIWNFPIWNFHPHRFDQHRGSGGAVVIYKYFTPLGCFSASSPRSLRLKSFGLRVTGYELRVTRFGFRVSGFVRRALAPSRSFKSLIGNSSLARFPEVSGFLPARRAHRTGSKVVKALAFPGPAVNQKTLAGGFLVYSCRFCNTVNCFYR